MLHFIPIDNNTQNTDFFEKEFDENTLWIVANSEAKRRLQNLYLKNKSIMSTQNILRATEYWSSLLVMNAPEWQLISESLIYTLMERWYESDSVEVQYQDIQRFKTYCDQVFPILLSEQKELFIEWLELDHERSIRLSGWTDAAKRFLQYLNSFHFVGQNWIISTLLQKSEIHFGSYQHYVFDLGNDIQPEEVGAILRLSEHADVTVLAPSAEYLSSYRSGRCYTKLDASYGEHQALEPASDGFFVRAPSVLSEVKKVTGYIRALLEQGVGAQNMAIVSSRPEEYWDLLGFHLEVEGIPVDKSQVVKYFSLPIFQDWMSRMKILIQDFTSGDLESYLNQKGFFAEKKKSYLEFKKNYSYLYSMKSADSFFENENKWMKSDVCHFSDFIHFLYSTWTESDYTLFNKIVDALVKDYNNLLGFTLDQWFSYLNLVVSRLEAPLASAANDGVAFCSPHQLDHHPYSHLFVLGCHRQALQITTDSPFSPEDVSRLDYDLGFYLPPSEDKKIEYDIRWLQSRTEATSVLSYSETDFNADPCVVSPMWLAWSQRVPELEAQGKTRCDLLMQEERQKFLQRVEPLPIDSNYIKLQKENNLDFWQPLEKEFAGRFSVSALQKYHQCAFTFFTTRVLKSDEQREFDLDIDPLFQGSLLHKILEWVVSRYPQLDIHRLQLETLYVEALDLMKEESHIGEDVLDFWRREKYRHLTMVERFIDEEKKWRLQVPQTQFLNAEVDVSGFIGIVDDQLVLKKNQQQGLYPFAAKVDRIDQDTQGNLAVFDYKTSKPADFKSFEKWPESFQIQMPLYALGIENGLADGVVSAPVVHAAYIFLKDGSRGSGYVLQGVEHGFQEAVSKKSKQNITSDLKVDVFDQLKEQIKKVMINIQEGNYKPQPLDPMDCPRCYWRKTCRAPHLK